MVEREWSTQFYLNGYSIGVFGFNPPNKYLIRLFQKSSIKIISKPLIETMQLGHVEDSSRYQETTNRIGLTSLAIEIKERLELLGYSYEDAEKDFLISKESQLNQMVEFDKRMSNSSVHNYYSGQRNSNYPDQEAFETVKLKVDYISKITFSDFIASIDEIINNNLRRVLEVNGKSRRSIIPKGIKNPLTRHLVCHGLGAFPFPNNLTFLRGLVEALEDNAPISYEFEGPNVCIDSLKNYYNELYDPKEISVKYGLKTLIVTEGQTDTEFIKKSLVKLYPHLSDLYHFLDFQFKEGSTKALIQIVRSLAASGIPNNIIAIFDNDVEGIEAIKSISNTTFPAHVRILRYPDISIANKYPVSSWDNEPLVFDNVNGKGCAIEMFLGKDCLTSNEGEFYFLTKKDERGQLNFARSKRVIQENFRKKLAYPIEHENWLEMKVLLKVILDEFK
jgi:hypothetical protein